MIKSLSASQIESFDPTNPFGCNRRWFLEKVKGIKPEQAANLILGDAVHGTLESFLKGAGQGVLHDLVIGAPGALEWLISMRKRVKHVEIKFTDLLLAGIPTVGRIDWIALSTDGLVELGDHKTTSNIGKYAKTKGQIASSVQMNIYARWLFEKTPADVAGRIAATQDFYQTKGAKKFECVSTHIEQRINSARILEIEATVEQMKIVAEKQNVEDVEPNEAACHIGFGCPHRAYCPRSGEFNMASLLDAFTSPSAPTPAPVLAVPQPPGLSPQNIPAAVLPPDAPASDPKLAADPPKVSKLPIVDVVTPEVAVGTEVKRPPGRPKGSQNKPRDLTVSRTVIDPLTGVVSESALLAPPGDLAPVAPDIRKVATQTGPVQIERITIRHGAKIGVAGSYSSTTTEVEATALVVGSVDEARAVLSLQVQAMMVKELEVYVKMRENLAAQGKK